MICGEALRRAVRLCERTFALFEASCCVSCVRPPLSCGVRLSQPCLLHVAIEPPRGMPLEGGGPAHERRATCGLCVCVGRTAWCGWQVVWLTPRPLICFARVAEAPFNLVNLITELLFVLPIGLFGYGAFVAKKYVLLHTDLSTRYCAQ